MQFEFIKHLESMDNKKDRSIIAIGNFDGVHIGHQEVLAQLKMHSELLKLPAWVMIFEPQPKEFFLKISAPPRLTSLREKIIALKRYAISNISCFNFNTKFAHLTAYEFVTKILVEYFNAAYILVGEDFRFGKDRAGDINLLRKLGEELGYQVLTIDEITSDQQRISSTRIRHALAEHNLSVAQSLIGRPYTVCGKVIPGDKRGRQLGFPTANIRLGKRVLPLAGVYAVLVHGLSASLLTGVANAGTRPTVDGQRRSLEVHLFNFDQEIYGRYIEIEFRQYVRSEMRFDSLQSLQEQISKDVAQAKAILNLT